MKTSTSALALTIAVALLAGPAFAQSGGTTGGDTTKQPGMQQPGATGTTGATDPAKPGATGATRPDAAEGEPKGQAAAGDKQQVRVAQEALKDQGMYEGEVDGIMGPKTQAALREFQRQEGLQETGRLDQPTMSVNPAPALRACTSSSRSVPVNGL